WRRANGLDFNESLIAEAQVLHRPIRAECLAGWLLPATIPAAPQGATSPKPAVHIHEGCFKFEQQPELDAYYPLKVQLHAARVHS
ncbi:hypothetical protein, partial [Caballeronia sp. M23-90]